MPGMARIGAAVYSELSNPVGKRDAGFIRQQTWLTTSLPDESGVPP